MPKFQIPDVLVDKCPYEPEHIAEICKIVDHFNAELDAAHRQVVVHGIKHDSLVVRPDVWKFMLADNALELTYKEVFEDKKLPEDTNLFPFMERHVRAFITSAINAAKNPKKG